MKVCYIAAGSSSHTMRIANWMAEHGQDVSIISYTPFTQDFHASIQKHEVKKMGPASSILNKPRRLWWNNPFLPMVMKGLMREIRPDITETHYVGSTGMLLARLANHHPHIMVCQGGDVLSNPTSVWYHKRLRESLLRADAIVVMSQHMRFVVNTITGGMASRVMATNTGVDPDVFYPGEQIDRKVILSVRHNNPVYDLKTLVGAIPLVQRDCPDASFLIAGKDTAKLVKDNAQVNCLGEVPIPQMPTLYRSASLYVSTAVSDGTSISTLEALATDLPCVLTDIPANRPWVSPEYLFQPRNSADLVRVILAAMENPPARGVNRNTAIKDADFQTEMQRLLNLYEELL